MRLEPIFPFNEFKCYLIFSKKENRRSVVLFKSNKERTTISYAKYLMSIKEGRILSREEEVDHKDNDKTNDYIENLQILTGKENRYKDNIRKKSSYFTLICPECKIIFKRRKTDILYKGNNIWFCDKDCLHYFLTRRLKKEDLIEIGKNQIIEEIEVMFK